MIARRLWPLVSANASVAGDGYMHITVRGLIALVGVIALGLAWEAHRTRIQRRAVATIHAADGSVKYNWQWKDGEPVPGGETARSPSRSSNSSEWITSVA